MTWIRLAVRLQRLAGVVADDRRRTSRLADRFWERLPLFPRKVAADSLRALVDEVGCTSQHFAACRRRCRAPFVERSSGGVDRFGDDLWSREAHRRHVLVRSRGIDVRHDLVTFATATGDERREFVLVHLLSSGGVYTNGSPCRRTITGVCEAATNAAGSPGLLANMSQCMGTAA